MNLIFLKLHFGMLLKPYGKTGEIIESKDKSQINSKLVFGRNKEDLWK